MNEWSWFALITYLAIMLILWIVGIYGVGRKWKFIYDENLDEVMIILFGMVWPVMIVIGLLWSLFILPPKKLGEKRYRDAQKRLVDRSQKRFMDRYRWY